jgi:hypothetical protein
MGSKMISKDKMKIKDRSQGHQGRKDFKKLGNFLLLIEFFFVYYIGETPSQDPSGTYLAAGSRANQLASRHSNLSAPHLN